MPQQATGVDKPASVPAAHEQPYPGSTVGTVGAQVALHFKHGCTVRQRLCRGLDIGPALVAHAIVCKSGARVVTDRFNGPQRWLGAAVGLAGLAAGLAAAAAGHLELRH